MSKESSGCYVIDSEYNVVNVNGTAKKLYPQLEVGKKCYKCLMNLDAPCGPCPVAANRKGPTTYMDPIRKISEIVDAVDIEIPGKGLCHALIFSTVENDAAFAATLPTSAEQLKDLALIKALTVDYYDVFSVDLADGNMILYRLNGNSLSSDSIYKKRNAYVSEIENYINKYVLEEDKAMMQEQCSLEYIKMALKKQESFDIHYRVVLNEEMHYFYRKIVRIGDENTFENIVVGIACEDEEVRNREQQIVLQDTLRKVELSTRTGLFNREAFSIYGDKLLQEYVEEPFDLCLLRIDNLEAIKRQYGSVLRDKVLLAIGDVLQEYKDDTRCIAYFGDGIYGSLAKSMGRKEREDNFEIIKEKVTKQSGISNISFKWATYENVSKDEPIEKTFEKVIYIVTTLRPNHNSDLAYFDKTLLERLDWNISIEKNFAKALENHEFKIWLQPKYSAHTKEIVGAEALVRWISNGEIITPNRFIPTLENSGLINLLDEEVFKQVCQLQRKLKDLGLKTMPISVNLSRASIFTKDISHNYSAIADAYGIEHNLIPIEITESAAVRASMIGEFADSLIEKGFMLHMDDFGSGYSSLASLQMIPFETIKIDKSLVDFIGNENGESLLKHTIAFARESGISVVAEGVETYEQFMFLKIAGCQYIQGYYFSKPIEEDKFIDLIK